MPPAELDQHLRHLLRGSDSDVRNNAAMQRFRIIEVHHVLGKIGAVAVREVEVRTVRRRIVSLDESFVLRRSGFDFKAVGRAVVSRAHQFIPVSARSFSVVPIRRDHLQMLAPVLVAQKSDHLRIRKQRNIIRPLDRVKIRNQRDRHPVVSAHSVIAADHCAQFSRSARPQHQRRLRAHSRQIHRRMSRGRKESQLAVRLFQQKSSRRRPSHTGAAQHQH